MKVVLLQVKDGRTVVGPIEERVLPSIESSEIDYLIFNMSTYDYHIRLFGYYSNIIGHSSINRINEKIQNSQHYDANLDRMGKDSKMESLPVYVRNCIDHPGEANRKISDYDLETSIRLLRKLIMDYKGKHISENRTE